jgi:5'(3')-deoxyribonucleotidase
MTPFLLDLDGVCANFLGEALKHFDTSIDEIYQPPQNRGVWEVEKLLGVTQEAFWARIGPDIFHDLPTLLDGMAVYSFMKDLKLDVHICTSPAANPVCYYHKALWVKHHFPELFPSKLCIYPRKYMLAKGSVLIDDSDKNCFDFTKAGGYSILFPRLWNSNHKLSSDPVPYVTKEILRYVNG